MTSLREIAAAAPGDSSANVGTMRTVINTMITAFVAGLIFDWTGYKIDLDDPVTIAVASGIIGGIIGIGYRLSRFIVKRWPEVGVILFGTRVEPQYPATPDGPIVDGR